MAEANDMMVYNGTMMAPLHLCMSRDVPFGMPVGSVGSTCGQHVSKSDASPVERNCLAIMPVVAGKHFLCIGAAEAAHRSS